MIAIFFAICVAWSCYSQNERSSISDSLGLASRVKADIVLSKIDTTSRRKILYSLLDMNYLIIIKQDCRHKEYVLQVDSVCNILVIKEINDDDIIEKLKAKKYLSRSSKKHLNRLLEDKRIIEEAFNTSQYKAGFITSMPNATWIAGVPSYFVMKDENNQRCGEYSLSSITIPCPINPSLWAYLSRKLGDNLYGESSFSISKRAPFFRAIKSKSN